MHYTYWIVVVFVRVCLCVCVWSYAWYIQIFSPPYPSSFKFEFAMKNLLGIPWNVKSMLRSLYHKLTLIQELFINQLPRWDYYLQGKYGHCNTYRFVQQFKRFLLYSQMVAPKRRSSQTRARVDPKKTGSCPSGGVRGTHISQPQPVEPPRFESKYLAARILALGNFPHVPCP